MTTPLHTPSPATLAAMASYVEPVPSYVEPVPSLPHYPAPHGAGVLAWVCATTIGTVIALCCLAASWVGSTSIASPPASADVE